MYNLHIGTLNLTTTTTYNLTLEEGQALAAKFLLSLKPFTHLSLHNPFTQHNPINIVSPTRGS